MLIHPVLNIDLDDFATESPIGHDLNLYELDRQLFSMLPAVPFGAHVILTVHRFRPFPEFWRLLRKDLKVQIMSKDPWTLADWQSALAEEEDAA
ncbi:hypothetical protein [Arthrobacter sp. C9C5]|uniref:hypothetical protein n=1 Tax=Arthrobacter sp. C9C5 TaxID=2735267 RepID=UPI001584D727|nr:hypothetical protein [Arthrobacter sp. C9C5]NUU30845.1 hypothetical protein [Arthrobacter sp. C9C5]